MRKARPYKQARRLRCALGTTLIELLLAMALTSMVCAAASSVLFATSHGTTTQAGSRTLAVRSTVVSSRIGAAVRSAQMVLSQNPQTLVLWTADTNGNGAPDLAEICRIDWVDTEHQITFSRAPADLLANKNTPYSLASTDFIAATQAIRGKKDFPVLVWATGVTHAAFDINHVDPHQANMIAYRLSIQEGEETQDVVQMVKLRFATCDN